MFGLTKREQRWKAEQQAAETVLAFVASVTRAAADARIAEAQSDAAELVRLREENARLLAAAAPTASPVVHPTGERTASIKGPRLRTQATVDGRMKRTGSLKKDGQHE